MKKELRITVTTQRSGQPVVGLHLTVVSVQAGRSVVLGETVTDTDGRGAVAWPDGGIAGEADIILYALSSGRLYEFQPPKRPQGVAPQIDIVLKDGLPVLVEIGGFPVDPDALAEVGFEQARTIAGAIGGQSEDKAAVRVLRALRPSLAVMLKKPGSSYSPLVRVVLALARHNNWLPDQQMQLLGLMFGVARVDDQVVECGIFEIRWPLSAGTANSKYAQRICDSLQNALDLFTTAPFSMPKPGKVTVWVGDGPSGGPSRIGIPAGRADERLDWELAHELMHVLQYEWDISGLGEWKVSLLEGGAVFAEDAIVDDVNRYLAEAVKFDSRTGPLLMPHLGLMNGGYDNAIFLKYIAEQHSFNVKQIHEPRIGVETYRLLLKRCVDAGSFDTVTLNGGLEALPWDQRLAEIEYLDWNRTIRINGETTVGNFWLACLLSKTSAALQDDRFRFLEFFDPILAYNIAPELAPVNAPAEAPVLHVDASEALAPGQRLVLSEEDDDIEIGAFGARVFEIEPDSGVKAVRLEFSALTQPAVSIVLADANERVFDIIRISRPSWQRHIDLGDGGSRTRIAMLKVIVAAGAAGVPQFAFSAEAVAPQPDVMITGWNCRYGQHYEFSSYDDAWTWQSPDLWIGGHANRLVVGSVNRINVRLTNQGRVGTDVNTGKVRVDVEWQGGDVLQAVGWSPVGQITDLVLPGYGAIERSIGWTPPEDLDTIHLRAILSSVEGDWNQDNKHAIGRFTVLPPLS